MKFNVKVKLNADFIEIEGGRIIVGVKSKPEGGKANRELLKKIAEYFKAPVSAVKIISGQTSRHKIIEVR